MLMVLADMIMWWYSRGWSWAFKTLFVHNNKKVLELFSIKDMLKTLFAPYRQTFAGKVRGTIGDKLRGMVDRTISRIIGFIIRLVLIVVGLVALLVNTAISILLIALWPAIPLLPLIAVILMLMEFSNAI